MYQESGILKSTKYVEGIDVDEELILENAVSSWDIRDLEKTKAKIEGVIYENLTIFGSCSDCINLKKKLKDAMAEDERGILESLSKIVVAYCKRRGRYVEYRWNDCFQNRNFWESLFS